MHAWILAVDDYESHLVVVLADAASSDPDMARQKGRGGKDDFSGTCFSRKLCVCVFVLSLCFMVAVTVVVEGVEKHDEHESSRREQI